MVMPGQLGAGEGVDYDYGDEDGSDGDVVDMDEDSILLMELVQDPNFQVLR